MDSYRPFDALKGMGLAASKARGQNFLRDPKVGLRIAELILSVAKPGAPVLEIGPGLGAITKPLLSLGARVTALELDRGLADALASWPEARDGALTVIPGDALSLDPRDLKLPSPPVVCGNLPYNVSSPLLFWFLKGFSGSPGVFMLQRELAGRIWAPPGGKDYGRLAVGLAPWYDAGPAFDVGPGSFQPRPKVTSSMVLLKPRPDPPRLDPGELGAFTALCFRARRKTILNNLGPPYGRERALAVLGSLGVDPAARPETLPPQLYVAMAEAFGRP